MIGQTLGHYRIVEKIGAGGMGEVYRAHDEQLDRDVALKLLPPGMLANESARNRFRKEALTLAKLNHPNIATVHDFDHQNDTDFLVMEYVSGMSLAQKLASGPLPEKEIAAIGAQIADALDEAHEHGIIHRDLKPANVMVSPKGRAKVLDFGLATLLQPANETATTDPLSQTHGLAGTFPYMSPEQLCGETSDARGDIYSAGAVLYEMATAHRAFSELSSARLTDAILHSQPVSPRALNWRVSSELERIILKCLEKDADNRYQSAKELGVDLRRLGNPAAVAAVHRRPQRKVSRGWLVSGATGTVIIAGLLIGLKLGIPHHGSAANSRPQRIQSLAVLPLENFSGDASQDYFADGMSDAIITNLSQIHSLRVISRTSVMQYKGTHKPIPQVARELHVDAVVEGSVLRSKGRVRISAELIQAANEQNLWAGSFEKNFTDVLALQDDVAKAIADEIQINLTQQEQAQLASYRAIVPQAYEAYLQGRYFASKRTGEALIQSIAYFQRAIQQDPTYAAAYAGLADAYSLLGQYTDAPPTENLIRAREAVEKALEIDPTLAEAHASLGYIRYSSLEWPGVEDEYRRAIQLNPNYAEAHHWYALALAGIGRQAEAMTEINRAQELDPRSLIISANAAWCQYVAGRYDQAIQQARKTLALDPSFAGAHGYLGQAYLEKGNFDKAIQESRKALSLSGETAYKGELGYAYGVSGRRQEAHDILSELIQRSNRQYVSPYDMALVYMGLGDKDRAFEWLDKAFQDRTSRLFNIQMHPEFASLRKDSRFAALVQRIGLPKSMHH
jgi:serine/threonine-protein kinase